MDETGLAPKGEVLLPEELTIQQLEELVGEFSTALAESEQLVVDGSQVNQVDAAGLQLLLAVAKEGNSRGKPFTLVKPNRTLESILEMTGAVRILSVRKEA